MKTYFLMLLAAALCLQVSTGCKTKKVVVVRAPAKTKPLPPGQAKKLTGAKSAKAYAPGQQKKTRH